jgi:mediator of RNA polymerase II transcription subunit 24
LDVKSTHEVKSLFEVGGSHWFVESMVRQLLRKDHASELSKSVGLIFGLMHVDLSECSMSLVSQVIPSYLISSAKQELLFEPKASALARLTVLTISSALNIKRSRNLKKGSELESLLKETPFSLRRQQKINFSETAKQDDLLEDPFIRSVAKLILLFSSVASDPDVSQRTVFPIVFLEQLIMCVKHESQTILQFLPLDTTMSLIRTSPENVTYEFLVTLGDLKTMKGRKTLAKALCQLSRVKRMQA